MYNGSLNYPMDQHERDHKSCNGKSTRIRPYNSYRTRTPVLKGLSHPESVSLQRGAFLLVELVLHHTYMYRAIKEYHTYMYDVKPTAYI